MDKHIHALNEKLDNEHSLSLQEYEFLLENRTDDAARELHYGKSVFIHRLIEISNICKNDCLYCGIRASNKLCDRYFVPEL